MKWKVISPRSGRERREKDREEMRVEIEEEKKLMLEVRNTG